MDITHAMRDMTHNIQEIADNTQKVSKNTNLVNNTVNNIGMLKKSCQKWILFAPPLMRPECDNGSGL